MKNTRSDRPGSTRAGPVDTRAVGGASRRAPGCAAEPDFWDELYWFAVICVGGWILFLAILPPAMVRLRSALTFETECQRRVEALSRRNEELQRVLSTFETDPHYREEVIRTILGVKKRGEVFLE